MSGSFYSSGTVTARKEHQCGDCGRTIEPGTQYTRTAGAAYGDFWTWKHCPHCGVLRQLIKELDEESYYHEDGLNVPEWVHEYGTPVELQWLAKMDTIKALGYYRITRWFRNRWLDKHGQLREIPAL